LVTCSIGIDLHTDQKNNAKGVDELMKNADLAMYSVKQNNKNSYYLYNNANCA